MTIDTDDSTLSQSRLETAIETTREMCTEEDISDYTQGDMAMSSR